MRKSDAYVNFVCCVMFLGHVMILEWNFYASEYHQRWFMRTGDEHTIATRMYSPETRFNLSASVLDSNNITIWYGTVAGQLKESSAFVPLSMHRIVPFLSMGEQAPYITSITHNVSLVRPGEAVRLTLTVHDPNNDPIYFLTCQDTHQCDSSTCDCVVIVPNNYQMSLTVRDRSNRVSPPFIVQFTKRMSFDWSIETSFNMPPSLRLEAPSVFGAPTALHVHINDTDIPFTVQWYTKRVKGICPVLDAVPTHTSATDILRYVDPPNETSVCVYGLSVADRFGSVSSSEVIVRSRSVQRHTPPETIRRVQSSTVAAYGDRVDFRVYVCHAIDIRWMSSCGILKYQSMSLDADACLWSSNLVVSTGQTCTVKYILSGRYRQSEGVFRLTRARRLEMLPNLLVRWNADEVTTKVEASKKVQRFQKPVAPEEPPINLLPFVLIFIFFMAAFVLAVIRRLRQNKIKYIEAPQKEPEEDMSKQFKNNINTMKKVHRKMRRERRHEWYKERHRKHYQHVLKEIVKYKRPSALDRVKKRLKLNGLKYIK